MRGPSARRLLAAPVHTFGALWRLGAPKEQRANFRVIAAFEGLWVNVRWVRRTAAYLWGVGKV